MSLKQIVLATTVVGNASAVMLATTKVQEPRKNLVPCAKYIDDGFNALQKGQHGHVSFQKTSAMEYYAVFQMVNKCRSKNGMTILAKPDTGASTVEENVSNQMILNSISDFVSNSKGFISSLKESEGETPVLGEQKYPYAKQVRALITKKMFSKPGPGVTADQSDADFFKQCCSDARNVEQAIVAQNQEMQSANDANLAAGIQAAEQSAPEEKAAADKKTAAEEKAAADKKKKEEDSQCCR
ncbi:unnamed protein product [Amoebophrya sp. A25]|nr:unnamed protein product [Amoebophrya sp. A25]|eukprot:GSA25T00021831001.1